MPDLLKIVEAFNKKSDTTQLSLTFLRRTISERYDAYVQYPDLLVGPLLNWLTKHIGEIRLIYTNHADFWMLSVWPDNLAFQSRLEGRRVQKHDEDLASLVVEVVVEIVDKM